MGNISKALVIVGLLAPGSGHALGLGEIKLHSYLNQPLQAEMPLVLSGEALGQIRIGLAAPEEFAKVGIARSPAASKLRFNAVQRRDGSLAIRVSSIDVITEPYLSFVMELTWPEGRMLRSFTVLLDPPDVVAPTIRTAALAFQQGDGVPGAGDQNPTHGHVAGTSGARSQGIPPMSPSEELYGPVARNERLWRIAERLKPDPAIPTQQMMMALFHLNPRAFSRASVNALNAGAYLRIPRREAVPSLAQAAGPDELPTGTALPATHPAQSAARPLPLAGAEATDRTQSGLDAPGTSPLMPRMSANPVDSVPAPAFEKLRRDNEQALARVAELERRVSELTRLVEERTRDAAATPATAPVSVTPPTADEPRVDRGTRASRDAATPTRPVEAESPATIVPTAPSVAASADTAPASAPAGLAVTPPPRPTIRSAAETEPAAATLTADGDGSVWPWLLALSGAVGAALFGVALRRRMAAPHAPALHRVDGEESESSTPKAWARSAPAGVMNPAMTEQPASPNATDPGTPEFLTPAIGETDDQVADALFEAEIYLSYGKYRQAEESVRKALALAPDRPQPHLKLLEVYAAERNADAFVALVGRLRTEQRLSDQDFWARVGALEQALGLPPECTEPAAEVRPSDAAPDETDQLIAKLRQFSLDSQSRGSESTNDGLADIEGLRVGDAPTRGTTVSPPAAAGDVSDLTPTSQAFRSTTHPGDDAHAIPYEPAPPHQPNTCDEPTMIDVEADAARSIEDLLKELSAMHFEEHLNANPDAAAACSDSPGAAGVPSAQEHDTTGTAIVAVEDLEAKLDLARAYADMSDFAQARATLNEVMASGTVEQRREAQALLSRLR